jgi:hypothetical protein
MFIFETRDHRNKRLFHECDAAFTKRVLAELADDAIADLCVAAVSSGSGLAEFLVTSGPSQVKSLWGKGDALRARACTLVCAHLVASMIYRWGRTELASHFGGTYEPRSSVITQILRGLEMSLESWQPAFTRMDTEYDRLSEADNVDAVYRMLVPIRYYPIFMREFAIAAGWGKEQPTAEGIADELLTCIFRMRQEAINAVGLLREMPRMRTENRAASQ